MTRGQSKGVQRRNPFNPDSSVSVSGDKLERGGLAKSLASLIRSYEADEALFIGITGPWGSGKTSFLKMMQSELEQHRFLGVRWLRPWLQGNQVEVIAATLDAIVQTTRGKDGLATQGVQAVKRFGAAVVRSTTVSVGGGAQIDLGALTKQLGRKENEQIEFLKEQAASFLRNSRRRAILLVDDCDRLEESEIRSLLRVMRAAMDLPNVVFLIGSDLRVLERALTPHSAQSETSDALAKFFQVMAPLPQPTPDLLRRMAHEELGRLQSTGADYDVCFSESEWNELLSDVDEYTIDFFRTPRDVVRWVNSCILPSIHLSGEINRADACLLYALQLFAPDAHSYLWKQRDKFFSLHGVGRDFVMSEDQRQVEQEFMDGFTAATGNAHPQPERLLKRLLSYSLWHAELEGLARAQRLGSPEYYQVGFALSVGVQGVSDRVVREMVDCIRRKDLERATSLIQSTVTRHNWFSSARAIARAVDGEDQEVLFGASHILMGVVKLAKNWEGKLYEVEDGVFRLVRVCLQQFASDPPYADWVAGVLRDTAIPLRSRIAFGIEVGRYVDDAEEPRWHEWTRSKVGEQAVEGVTSACAGELKRAPMPGQGWGDKVLYLLWVSQHVGTSSTTDIVMNWLKEQDLPVSCVINAFASTWTTHSTSSRPTTRRDFQQRNYDTLRRVVDPDQLASFIRDTVRPVASAAANKRARRNAKDQTEVEMVEAFLALHDQATGPTSDE